MPVASAQDRRLKLRLSVQERKKLAQRPTKRSEAYELYLKGRYHLNRRTTELPWFGTARGRIGYAWGSSMMPYITVGAAFAGVDNTRGAVSTSDTVVGWTAGLGLEYMMWSNWSVKLEYLYADLGTADGPASTSVDITANIVRAGINYRF